MVGSVTREPTSNFYIHEDYTMCRLINLAVECNIKHAPWNKKAAALESDNDTKIVDTEDDAIAYDKITERKLLKRNQK